MTNYPLVIKPSPMIQMNVQWDSVEVLEDRCKLTALQRKVINAFIYTIKTSLYPADTYKVPLVWLKNVCDVKGISNEEFAESLLHLTKIRYTFRYRKGRGGRWESCVVFPQVLTDIDPSGIGGTVEFIVIPSIRERILNPSIYVKLDQAIVSKFRSSYAIVVYEFLMDYSKIPIPKLSLEEFKDMLDIKDMYPDIRDFKKRILEVIVREINENSGISCYYDLQKINGVYFIQWNVEHKMPTTTTCNEICKENYEFKYPQRPGESDSVYQMRIDLLKDSKDNT